MAYEVTIRLYAKDGGDQLIKVPVEADRLHIETFTGDHSGTLKFYRDDDVLMAVFNEWIYVTEKYVTDKAAE